MAETTSVQSETRYIMTKNQLEDFHCYFCQKLLSVKPINRAEERTSCGRCVKDEVVDNVSSNNMLMKEYVFPCINMYEGCNKLLRPEEIEEHEAECPDDDWPCRNCSNEFFPLHQLRKHYQEEHAERLLESTVFMFDLSHRPPSGKWCYLYEHETTLFYIWIEQTANEGPYCLYAEHLGVGFLNSRFKQRFIMYYGDRRHYTGEFFTYPELRTVKRNLHRFSFGDENLVTVNFSLYGPAYQGVTTYQDRIITKMNASLIASNWEYSESQLAAPKKLFLFKRMHQWFKLKPGSSLDYFLVHSFSRRFYPHCYRCMELDYTTYWCRRTNFVSFYVIGDCSYTLCSYCKKLPGTQSYRSASLRFPILAYKMLNFFCMWNYCTWLCENAEEAWDHHVTCDRQPVRHCPEESCDFVGMLPQMEKHFGDEHPRINFCLKSFFKTHFGSGREKKFYFLVRNAFVRVEANRSEGVWRAKFSLCGNKPIFAGKKLKISAFDHCEMIYLGSCIPPEEMTISSHKMLLIKGYLE